MYLIRPIRSSESRCEKARKSSPNQNDVHILNIGEYRSELKVNLQILPWTKFPAFAGAIYISSSENLPGMLSRNFLAYGREKMTIGWNDLTLFVIVRPTNK